MQIGFSIDHAGPMHHEISIAPEDNQPAAPMDETVATDAALIADAEAHERGGGLSQMASPIVYEQQDTAADKSPRSNPSRVALALERVRATASRYATHKPKVVKPTAVFVNESRSWVLSDVNYYANRQDVIDYLETLYPTTYDAQRRRYVQNYNVDVSWPFGLVGAQC